MLINQSKTELIVHSKGRSHPSMVIQHGSQQIKSTSEMKALGVTISWNLSWDKHINSLAPKLTLIIRKLKFLRRWLSLDDALKVLTSQFFGTLYYAISVWINLLSFKSWRRLESLHYRALRAVHRDFRCALSKQTLNKMSKRATPRQWANYITTSEVIKLFNTSDARIVQDLRSNVYINDRKPRKGTFVGAPKYAIGKQSLRYRIREQFCNLDFDWIGIDKDSLRRNLKRLFVPLDSIF